MAPFFIVAGRVERGRERAAEGLDATDDEI